MHNQLWRRLGKALVLGWICLLLLVSPALAAKEAQAERYDVELTLRTDGTVEVTETLVFRYQGGPFTFVKREVPADWTDGLQFISASMDGRAMGTGSAAGQVEVQSGSSMQVTWHFAEVSNSTHTFTLTYRATGVVRKNQAGDLLVYTPLPREHDYPIAASTLRVKYPASVSLTGKPGFSLGRGQVESGAGLAVFSAGPFGSDESYEVQMEFAPGSLTPVMPGWQAAAVERAQRTEQSMLPLAGLAALIGLGGIAGILTFASRFQSAAKTQSAGPSSLQPSKLSPALAGTLVNSGARPNSTALMAILFDLARRGVLEIVEQPKAHWYSSKDFEVRLLRVEKLEYFEETLLQVLFQTSTLQAGLSAGMTQGGQQLQQKWSQISDALTAELTAGGWIDPARRKDARNWSWGAGTALALSVALVLAAFVLVNWFGGWVTLPPIVLVIVTAIWLTVAVSVAPLTARGELEATQWRGFRDYLKQVARGRETLARPDGFEVYLPYAAAFGQAHQWASFFQKQGAQLPAWFQSLGGRDDFVAFVGMVDSSSTSTGSSDGGGGGGSAGGGSSSTG